MKIETLLNPPHIVRLEKLYTSRVCQQLPKFKSSSELDHLFYQRHFRQASHKEEVTRSSDWLIAHCIQPIQAVIKH